MGEPGEIRVRTPSLLKAYWNRPDVSATALCDGWLLTGDIGILDEGGYLHFLGRRKEMLKVRGMSVFPGEVEMLLAQHPAVLGCGIVGRPDAERGEVPVAFVVLKELGSRRGERAGDRGLVPGEHGRLQGAGSAAAAAVAADRDRKGGEGRAEAAAGGRRKARDFMHLKSLLIANRGEIAIRIARTAAELGMRSVSVFSEDDVASLHVRRTDASHALRGHGPAAYLDIAQIVRAALENGCDAVHPGYGFLSENAAFARACAEAGLVFVGPPAELLDLYGDKVRARSLAAGCGVPLAAGIGAPARVEDVQAFLRALGPGAGVMIKAVAGGGGRGMRAVTDAADVPAAHARCQSEALRAFGNGDVYAERLIPHARHVEVQILGDGTGAVTHLWERECTLQRRSQKLVEIAPSPGLEEELRQHILAAALRMAADVRHAGLATFEFLVDPEAPRPEDRFVFIECNPRLQVEHTVTEAVTGLDLVRLQLLLASDYRLDALGLTQDRIGRPVGHAMQLRINMETMRETVRFCPPAAACARSIRPRAGACASIRSATPDTPPRRSSIRCWRS